MNYLFMMIWQGPKFFSNISDKSRYDVVLGKSAKYTVDETLAEEMMVGFRSFMIG